MKWNERADEAPVFTVNLINHGDSFSLTGGVQRIYAQRIALLIEDNELGQVVRWRRCGNNGASFKYAWSGGGYDYTMLQDIPLRVKSALSVTLPNWVIVLAGTNGVMLAAHTAAAEYSDFVEYITALLAVPGVVAGRVVVNTMLPRTSLNETVRGDFNASIVTGAATYGYKIARLDLDANIGAAGQNLNATYFYDGTHPTDVGHGVIADINYAVMFP